MIVLPFHDVPIPDPPAEPRDWVRYNALVWRFYVGLVAIEKGYRKHLAKRSARFALGRALWWRTHRNRVPLI